MGAPEQLQVFLRRRNCRGEALRHLLADIAGLGLHSAVDIDGFLRQRCPAAALPLLSPHGSKEAILPGTQLPAFALTTLAGAWQTQLCIA
eukprot:7721582-Alexandrium_andersonii.AAC.1